MGSENTVKAVVVIAIIAVLLVIILVPSSFHGVEYYQFGFVRRKSTGSVNTDKVYTSGYYLIGIDYEFKNFKADAHFVDLESVAVFTSDRLEVRLDCTFQYFLREEDLQDLHDTYDIQYEDILRNNAIDELKGATVDFSTRDFGEKRAEIEKTMFNAVKKRLGGNCCKPGCQNSPEGCEVGCKKVEDCTKEDKGFFADVRYFQLGFVDIPDDVISRNLQTLTQLEDGFREEYIQLAQLVRIRTEEMVTQIQNAAEEISQNATAQAALILSQANAEARAVVEDSYNRGLSKLYTDLGITNQDQKASLNYIRTLRDQTNVFLTVNFNTLVTGPVYGGQT
ncbi:uncharacterized protein LOC110990886 [Acanthaster planci]|uniref:Uncharacterized protein LOC110990886 n=1 Tax=Acanthaster planci TaxID=133434 RepID=A0A8B8A6P7_ACAPL|nr:uncharacterized protein LOC110990886 [Acanthaster planci]XP_022111671.1 uncharacterized protein LOC110990886 [Acanthaster planci]XP_022111679.1 uncharacterized protein LOC110990886 [Acanthaster planci]